LISPLADRCRVSRATIIVTAKAEKAINLRFGRLPEASALGGQAIACQIGSGPAPLRVTT